LFCDRFLPLVVFGVAAVSAAVLWQHQGGGRTFIAMGDGPRAMVLAPQAGSLVEWLVPSYAEVRRGEPVAVLRGFDPRAALDRERLHLDRMRMQAEPALSEVRAVDLERIRLELARIRSELAIATVRLDFATREVNRLEPLFQEKLITETTMELSRSTRDMNAAEVREKERLMQEVEGRLRTLEAGGQPVAATEAEKDVSAPNIASTEPILEDAITTLVAPIDGTIGPWLRRPGEFLVEGEPVVSVQGPHAERIIGYMRQPFAFDPEAGMPVQVVRRTSSRDRFSSVIQHVGSHFENITNALAFIREGSLMDMGLPVVVELPPDQAIRPGEIVDVLVQVSSSRRSPGGPTADPDAARMP